MSLERPPLIFQEIFMSEFSRKFILSPFYSAIYQNGEFTFTFWTALVIAVCVYAAVVLIIRSRALKKSFDISSLSLMYTLVLPAFSVVLGLLFSYYAAALIILFFIIFSCKDLSEESGYYFYACAHGFANEDRKTIHSRILEEFSASDYGELNMKKYTDKSAIKKVYVKIAVSYAVHLALLAGLLITLNIVMA